MNEASQYLRVVAERVAATGVTHCPPRAILLTGSVAEGESDYYSHIDLITYHDELPSDEQLRAIREHIGLENVVDLGTSREEGEMGEQYRLRGVECQVIYVTLNAWEKQMAEVLEQHDPKTLTHKAIDGLLHGIALHGGDMIERWQARALDYPPGLARAMVEAYLNFFPLWRLQDWFAPRDATLWFNQVLVESSQNILGVLSGVNHLYYVPFQFKRAHRFISRMQVAPDQLAERLDALFNVPFAQAIAELERLVSETVTIVETHLPEVDTSRVRRSLGARRQPWQPDPSYGR